MITAYQIDYTSYLQHHGVLGQKWGVRNGPPYPLGASNHSSSEKKAGWRSSLKNSSDDEGSDKTSSKAKTFVEKYRQKTVSVATGSVSDEAVALAVQFTAAVAAMAIVTALDVHSFKKERMRELENRKDKRTFEKLEDVPRINSKMSAKQNMKVVNPDFPSSGTTMNCTFCTTAMAMREKGYDVRAAKTPNGFYSSDLFRAAFNSPTVRMKKTKTYEDVLHNLEKNGDGAYGNLTIHWKGGGGHSVFWKNENGETHIYDGQSGAEYDKQKTSKTFSNCVKMNKIAYNRLDNCEPTEYALGIVEKG